MLRYFYLIYLLTCFQAAFCYDYSEPNFFFAIEKKRKLGINRYQKQRDTSHGKRLQYETDTEVGPLEQIDVANFIRQADESAVDDAPYRFQNKKSRRPKEYSEYGALGELSYDDDSKKRDKNLDYLNLEPDNASKFKLNSASFEDSKNPIQFSSDGFSQDESKGRQKKQNRYDNALNNDYNRQTKFHRSPDKEKKCSLKQMKFPFFSRKPSETTKPKKGNKRRHFNFVKSKKEKQLDKEMDVKVYKSTENNINLNTKLKTSTDSSYNMYKIKRSYKELLCPECKRKFISYSSPNDDLVDQRHANNKIIHNSRQFYQDVSDIATDKTKETNPNENENSQEVTEDLKPSDGHVYNEIREQKQKRKKRQKRRREDSIQMKETPYNQEENVVDNGEEDPSEVESNRQIDEVNCKENKEFQNLRRRRKRRDEISDKNRQMHELEEVQKKIDNADVTMPSEDRSQKEPSDT